MIRYYAGKEDSYARAYEPELARRARMRIAPAPTNLGP
jgi:hypothetical protein